MNYRGIIDCLMLSGFSRAESQQTARMIGELGFGMSFAEMLCQGELPPEAESVVERVAKGEPVQYALGKEMFCGEVFAVGEGVLIPRPETAELCRWIISEHGGDGNILDIGTGSGAIAVTLAKACRGSVYAMDISPKALAYARRNAEALGADVRFLQEDILSRPQLEERFSLIVSNPPYILEREREAMEARVLDYEPSLALFVPDDDGLLFYRAIADFALRHLEPGGALYFEINPLCRAALVEMLGQKGFSNVTVRKDQEGRERLMKVEC